MPADTKQQVVDKKSQDSYSVFDGSLVFSGKFVVRVVRPKKTVGGITLPEQARERPVAGQVVAAAKDVLGDLSVGDWVVFSKHIGAEVVFPWNTLKDGAEYFILRLEDCFMRWTNSAYNSHLQREEDENKRAIECLAAERDAIKKSV